jgi:hypothetical protein
LGRVRRAIYARMEEISFRSGAALAVSLLVAAGLAIVLAITLNGHSAAATGVPGPGITHSTSPPSPALSTASPSVRARVAPAASLMPVDSSRPPTPVTGPTAPPPATQATSVPATPTPRPRVSRSPLPCAVGPYAYCSQQPGF